MTGANAKIKRIYVGDKQVRPAFQLKLIFDFSTKDWHGYTRSSPSGSAFIIDTTNQRCKNNDYGYQSIYKQVNYKKCWQRIKARAAGTTSHFSLICGIGNNYAPSSGFSCSLGYDGAKFFVGVKGMSSYSNINLPSGFDGTQWHYYDTIRDNGNVTVKILDLNENVISSGTYNASETTQKYIGFSGGSYGDSGATNIYFKEYRLAYEE